MKHLIALDCRNRFDLTTLSRERVSKQCVCCGSEDLKKSPAVLMPFVAHRVFGWTPVLIDESWGLKTIKSGNVYSICNSLFCNDCGFLFSDIRFSELELTALYSQYRDKEYNDLREFYEPGYTARNASLNSGIAYIGEIEKFLEPHLTFPLSILDWGGDTGKNTPFKHNNEVFDIYDISNKPVIDGATTVSKKEAFEKKYTLIVCSHVLEHVSFPSDLILDIKNIMTAESILYIEVPCEDIIRIEGNDLHKIKKHWHEHINFYSEKSLVRLLDNCGLSVISIKKFVGSAGGNSEFLFQIACKLSAELISGLS
jgi:hypothetical protein